MKTLRTCTRRNLIITAVTMFVSAGVAFAAVCSQCQGAGTGQFACDFCKGTGKNNGVKCVFCNGKGFQKCPACNGTGHTK